MLEHGREGSHGEHSAVISTRTVQFLHEYTGRGPTKARTTIGRDTVMVVMEDTLTQSERKLVEAGHASKVLDTRHEFQKMMRADLVALVEEQTGRTVRAFMSDNHIDPDVAAEVFILEPLPLAEEPS